MRNFSLLAAIGVSLEGYHDILCIVEGAKEDRDATGADNPLYRPQEGASMSSGGMMVSVLMIRA